MDFHPDPVAQAVDEVFTIAGVSDDLAGYPVKFAGRHAWLSRVDGCLLGSPVDFVDFPHLISWFPVSDRPAGVRSVAFVHGP